MAKNIITRATALSNAIALFPEDAPEVEVLTKMLVSITKPRTGSKTPSKARLMNENLAREVRDAMPEGKAVDGKWLQSHVAYLTSPQKVAAVMRVARELGYTDTLREGRTTSYILK